ncbi:SLAM family member 6-like [Tupaia chinensis]|uniref:SLAM family member 6-like n=1 Tax=Tupaia chinensis TaxID=246437 RepID=UPI000FFB7924|nr:SLAM family member 6-like [Tupaia chinensis]
MRSQLLLLLLLLQSQEGNAVSQSTSTPVVVNGALGKSVILPLEFPTGGKAENITSIIVLHSGRSIAFINPREAGRAHVTDPKWKTRLNFIHPDSVQLHNLTMADAGPYSAQMRTENSSRLSSYTLRIFRQLRRPQVEVDSVISENGSCIATLRCSVEDADHVTYQWTPMGPWAVVSQEGSVLSDTWCLHDLDRTYTCMAQNPVSSHSSTPLLVGQLCTGSKAAEGTYCPVKWIFLGKGLLLLVFLGVLATWHIQTWMLSMKRDK